MKVLVGTLNPVKIAAVRVVFPEAEGYSADHGLDGQWRSVAGQPIGQVQTVQGALNRMSNCPSEVAIGVEDGLVAASELGLPATGQWYNQTVVVYRKEQTFVQWGTPIPCEFSVAEDAPPEEFAAAMQTYQEWMVPLLAAKEDLYRHWTASWPGGPCSRGHFITGALQRAVRAQELYVQAQKVLEVCVRYGMSASAGARYRGMLWTRDLDYMTPAYLALGHQQQVQRAWRQLASETTEKGQVPIVMLDPAHAQEWLQGRVDDWRVRLAASGYDLPPAEGDPESDYWRLWSARDARSPVPSFALRHYMEGSLAQLTPGTQDSELHFWRTALRCEWTEVDFWHLGKALLYFHQHVLDPGDGLPRGADTRDIFAESLFQAKLLTNAVFWYEVLGGIEARGNDIERALIFHDVFYCENLPPALEPLRGKRYSISWWARTTRERLAATIRERFFDVTPPRDFLPGPAVPAKEPVPAFIQSLLDQDPVFAMGTRPDPQGLAYAVLAGLCTTDEVVEWWRLSDSPTGVTVFVPISAREGQEQELLMKAKGFVVWPHINWIIVRAAYHLGTPKAKTFAREQQAKLLAQSGTYGIRSTKFRWREAMTVKVGVLPSTWLPLHSINSYWCLAIIFIR
jgi:non-canonical (house-cleaning) NTP pyrophosphatase